ncbi:class I SAM-dependent methyltransferase [Cohnella silvisoli]|uniref:Class I SAM-dependent methyltransferase n=1 Tax=Cohnella silvisoli TaxID=2873699 RepID=A0ABV1KQ68_9BACL|nr:class I SAM-dependent methyltransferase [Cohnella silvisoli]MCD9022094.1 class I SAM-dependent methyltransferase [Cohnella silvisoli]
MLDNLYQILSILLLAAVLWASLSIVYVSWKNGISPMPSSAPVRQAVAEEISRLSKKGVIVEAGSGWGTLALHVAKRCRGWRIVGIENSAVPLWVSRLIARLSRASVTFVRGDLYAYSYEEVELVLCYLYPGAMKRLSPIFQEQLKPGARIISVCFSLPGWQPDKIITCRDLYRTKIYVYDVKNSVIEK